MNGMSSASLKIWISTLSRFTKEKRFQTLEKLLNRCPDCYILVNFSWKATDLGTGVEKRCPCLVNWYG